MQLQQPDKPYLLSVNQISQQLQANIKSGLSFLEANNRLAFFGKNVLETYQQNPWYQLLIQQFTNPLAWVLLLAGTLAFAFQELLEGFAILVVILINAFIGFWMEWQAMQSMEALRKLSQAKIRVLREETIITIDVANLVLGDVIFLEAGDIVPADCRIIQQSNLGVQEAALTGESIQVRKQTKALKKETILAEQNNLLFKGTTISRGNAKAIVVATGKATQLGEIAQMAHEATKETTPLEKKLNVLSQKLLWLTLALTLLILVIGLIQGKSIYLMAKTAIALAIAAIPEGLPIVATIALAKGMLRLANHHVIVKKLSAVETLGETTVIFTDKTGTLTENRLSVDTLVFEFDTAEVHFEKEELIFNTPNQRTITSSFAFQQLCKVSALCNNATISYENREEENSGDPLEIALLQFSQNNDHSVQSLRRQYPRLKEIPFDSNTKMMGTLHRQSDSPNYLVCIKGALEVVLDEADYVLTKTGKVPINKKQTYLAEADKLAAKGLRILAFAYSELQNEEENFFHNVTFIGFIGFLDPPRASVKTAVNTCQQAGIKVVMVTGDHPQTAKNIALKTGLISTRNATVIHGKALKPLSQCSQNEQNNILNINVFARVSPAQKLDLISTYQKKGSIVGMTGDGINDMPALKKADIGIAMGQRGTEAAKEVADLVLEDDSFNSIVVAIKQGRGIFANIRYFVIYLLSCNLSELLVVAFAALSNMAMPLLPLQILFLNMVTDVFPALALGMNKEADNVMQIAPRNPKEPIIHRPIWITIIIYALSMTLAVVGIFVITFSYLGLSAQTANNLAFYTLVLTQLWHVFNLPDKRTSFISNEITQNKHIWLAILTCIGITILAYFTPIVAEVLQLQSISYIEIALVLNFSLIPVILIQLVKRVFK